MIHVTVTEIPVDTMLIPCQCQAQLAAAESFLPRENHDRRQAPHTMSTPPPQPDFRVKIFKFMCTGWRHGPDHSSSASRGLV